MICYIRTVVYNHFIVIFTISRKAGAPYTAIAINLFLHYSTVFPNKSYFILKYTQSTT